MKFPDSAARRKQNTYAIGAWRKETDERENTGKVQVFPRNGYVGKNRIVGSLCHTLLGMLPGGRIIPALRRRSFKDHQKYNILVQITATFCLY